MLAQRDGGFATIQFQCLDHDPAFRQLHPRIDQRRVLQRRHLLRPRLHPDRAQRCVHRADVEGSRDADLTGQRRGQAEALGSDAQRCGKAMVGETRRPVGQPDFAHVDFPGGARYGGCLRFRRRAIFSHRKQCLPIQQPLDVTRRGKLGSGHAHARHVNLTFGQIQVCIADARLGKFQHRIPAAARCQYQVLHQQIGALDPQPGHVLARLVANHGKTVAQAGRQGAGRHRVISRDPDHAQQLGKLHALQPELTAGCERIQSDVALPFEDAALLRQFGRNQVIAAIPGQGGQAIKLDSKRPQHHLERLARAIGVGVFNVAVGNLDGFDQQPHQGVGWRLFVFLEFGNQRRPVQLASGLHHERGLRPVELEGLDTPGPARQPGRFEVDVEAVETGQWCTI